MSLRRGYSARRTPHCRLPWKKLWFLIRALVAEINRLKKCPARSCRVSQLSMWGRTAWRRLLGKGRQVRISTDVSTLLSSYVSSCETLMFFTGTARCLLWLAAVCVIFPWLIESWCSLTTSIGSSLQLKISFKESVQGYSLLSLFMYVLCMLLPLYWCASLQLPHAEIDVPASERGRLHCKTGHTAQTCFVFLCRL